MGSSGAPLGPPAQWVLLAAGDGVVVSAARPWSWCSRLLKAVGLLTAVAPLTALAQPFLSPARAQQPVALAQPPLVGALSSPPLERADSGGELTVRVLLADGPTLSVAATDHPLALRSPDLVASDPQLLAPGEVLSVSVAGAQLQLQRANQLAPISVRELWLEPLASGLALGQSKPLGDFQLRQRGYRGQLQLVVKGGKVLAINHLGLESYLPSVVGSEMPASWPQAALRAQAVAARTYALRQRSSSELFDVSATVASQVYRGVEAETPSTLEAVASTRGQVLMFGTSLVEAVFHSSSGGSTENSGDLWGTQMPYLVSVPDVDQDSPVSKWQQRLEPSLLLKAFAEIGGVNRIEILSTTGSGRVRQARVIGPAGTLVVTGPELRSRLGLRSTLVHFELVGAQLASNSSAGLSPGAGFSASDTTLVTSPTDGGMGALPALPPQLPPLQVPAPTLVAIGRGFGHGVGMSQWGAYTLAQRGEGYQAILRYYFRGTDLKPYPLP